MVFELNSIVLALVTGLLTDVVKSASVGAWRHARRDAKLRRGMQRDLVGSSPSPPSGPLNNLESLFHGADLADHERRLLATIDAAEYLEALSQWFKAQSTDEYAAAGARLGGVLEDALETLDEDSSGVRGAFLLALEHMTWSNPAVRASKLGLDQVARFDDLAPDLLARLPAAPERHDATDKAERRRLHTELQRRREGHRPVWQVRLWRVVTANEAPRTHDGFLRTTEISSAERLGQLTSLEELSERPCLILLGAPGSGKTNDVDRVCASSRAARAYRLPVLHLREFNTDTQLAQELGLASQVLGSGIASAVEQYVDGLDEWAGMGALSVVFAAISREARRCGQLNYRLRITCRSAQWTEQMTEQLRRVYPGSVETYTLSGLDENQIRDVSHRENLQADAFIQRVREARAQPIAENPLALTTLLIPLARRGGQLPSSRRQVYEHGTHLLAEGSRERDEMRVGHPRLLKSNERLRYAERIAALCVLAGRRRIRLTSAASGPTDDDLTEQEMDIEHDSLQDVLDTGFFDTADGEGTFAFKHENITEFLAAKACTQHSSPESVLDLLTYGDGRLAPQLTGLLEWWAALDDRIAPLILRIRPRILLSSDILCGDDELTRRAVEAVLEAAESGQLTAEEIYGGMGAAISGVPPLDAAESVLRRRLKSTSGAARVLTLRLSAQCQAMLPDVMAFVLDDSLDHSERAWAARVLASVELNADQRTALKPLLRLSSEHDPHDELLANALRIIWDDLGTDRWTALRVPHDSYFLGGYQDWLSEFNLHAALERDGLEAAVPWALTTAPALDPQLNLNLARIVDSVVYAYWSSSLPVTEAVVGHVTQFLERGGRFSLALSAPAPGGWREQRLADPRRLELARRLVEAMRPKDTQLRYLGECAGAETPLAFMDDFVTFIDRAVSAETDELAERWARLASGVFVALPDAGGEAQKMIVRAAMQHNDRLLSLVHSMSDRRTMVARVASLNRFGGETSVELGSDVARQMDKRFFEDRDARSQAEAQRTKIEEALDEDDRRRALRIGVILTASPSSEKPSEAWSELSVLLGGHQIRQNYELDINELPLFQRLSDQRHTQLIQLACRALSAWQPQKLRTQLRSFTGEDIALLRALLVVEREDSEQLEHLTDEMWSSLTLGAIAVGSTRALLIAHQWAQTVVTSAVHDLISRPSDDAYANWRIALRTIVRVDSAFADDLTPCLEQLAPVRAHELARALYQTHRPIVTRTIARLIKPDERGLELATAALSEDTVAAWPMIWSVWGDRANETWARRLFERSVCLLEHEEIHRELTDDELGALAVWVYEMYGAREWPSGTDTTSVATRIVPFQNHLLAELADRGLTNWIRQLADTGEWGSLLAARAERRRAELYWQPLPVQAALQIVNNDVPYAHGQRGTTVTHMITSVHIRGYRSIRDLDELPMRPVTVLIGANGAGKSNLLSAFKLLAAMPRASLRKFVAAAGGASAMLHRGETGSARTLEFETTFESRSGEVNPEVWVYRALLVPSLDNLVFEAESVGSATDRQELGTGHRESKLSDPPVSSGDVYHASVRSLLAGVRFFHFQDTSAQSALRTATTAVDHLDLHPDGGNLAAVLLALEQSTDEEDRRAYQRIGRLVRLIAPSLKALAPTPFGTGVDPTTFRIHDPSSVGLKASIRLDWIDNNDHRFGVGHLSDGTLRAIALVTALGLPAKHRPWFIAIDEPELGLHPSALALIAGLVKSVSSRTQVLLATHSPALLDHFEPSDVVVTEQDAGGTRFHRLDPDELSSWLEDYTLSELYDKNVLGGRP